MGKLSFGRYLEVIHTERFTIIGYELRFQTFAMVLNIFFDKKEWKHKFDCKSSGYFEYSILNYVDELSSYIQNTK